MTTSKPLISVIMPVYNGGSTIRQAVESVFCQNIPLELLVIDDGSTGPDFRSTVRLPESSWIFTI